LNCSIYKDKTHNVGNFCETIIWAKFGGSPWAGSKPLKISSTK